MNCQEVRSLLDGYADNELDVTKALEVERHIATCAGCTAIRDDLIRLRTAIKSADSLYYAAPRGLERRIRKSMKGQETRWVVPGLTGLAWRNLGIAFAVLLLVSLGLFNIFRDRSSDEAVMREIISGHVRSMMVDHLTDVPSTDQHTVKPWFNGKLDFSPEVRDLSHEGYTLIGGRLDYIGNSPAAALVYQRRKHIINLFLWRSPQEADSPERLLAQQGYNLARWTKGGITYWAISDINMTDLQDFAQALQRPAQG